MGTLQFLRKTKTHTVTVLITILLAMISLIMIYPILFTFATSFMSAEEIDNQYFAIADGFRQFKLIPYFATLKQYKTVLISNNLFLHLFWGSARNVALITAGQVMVSSMAAFAFTMGKFKFKNALLFLYITAALLPFQVTLVPNYLTIQALKLMNTEWALILPAVFSPFGVFLLSQQMKYIPLATAEAASIDGAGLFEIFIHIFLPLSKPSIFGLSVLCFIDNWNMIEQPLVYITDIAKYPLSLYLFIIKGQDTSFVCAAAFIFMLLPLLVFVYANEYLVTGIELSAIKG